MNPTAVASFSVFFVGFWQQQMPSGVITRCGAGRHLLDDGGHFITIFTDGAYLSVFKQNNSKCYEPI